MMRLMSSRNRPKAALQALQRFEKALSCATAVIAQDQTKLRLVLRYEDGCENMVKRYRRIQKQLY